MRSRSGSVTPGMANADHPRCGVGLSTARFGLRRCWGAGWLVALVLLVALPAQAQYPQDAATAGTSDTTVEMGQRVIIGGEGWKPGSQVALTLRTESLGEARVDPRGNFSTTVAVPEDTPGGERFISVVGTSVGGEPSEIGIRLLVAGSSTEQEVSFTSVNIGLWMLLALGLILVGMLAALGVRRRTSTQG